ncbi:hypothetical protein V493_01904 [Pseudogymnoascus sp. VKM F-4281 (FW-2241)]|nr:hypothetical protein V493_01904 [Pseudogymnoascus sp. VKM F-4281 (FW-2241)]
MSLDQQVPTTTLPSLDVYERVWKELHPDAGVRFEPHLSEAMEVAKRVGEAGAGAAGVGTCGVSGLAGQSQGEADTQLRTPGRCIWDIPVERRNVTLET